MSFLNMCARVTIGDFVCNNLNSFEIQESVKDISDSARIILPRSYQSLEGKPILNYIEPGMSVTIESGYNGDLQTDFTGYVRPGISADYPIIIECDELSPLRKNTHILSYRSVTLKELLTTIIPTTYKIECPDVQLGKIVIDNSSTLQILKWLKDKWGLFTRINENVLSIGWPYDYNPSFTKNHRFIIGQNIKSIKDLKFETTRDDNVQVNVSVGQKNGKKKQLKFGSKTDEARVIPVQRYDISDTEAEEIAKSILQRTSYNGYTGSIIGFGVPRVHAGDSITIVDPFNLDREGTYLVERMTLDFSEAHIERTSYLSFKVS